MLSLILSLSLSIYIYIFAYLGVSLARNCFKCKSVLFDFDGSSLYEDEVNEPVLPEYEDECVSIDDELRVLLAESSPPPKKRTMRMYADDVEEELKKSRLAFGI